MTPDSSGKRLPSVWCPVIPDDMINKLSGYDDELRALSSVYDDWAASMRGRSNSGGEVGIYLDRIRMLMIAIGISSGTNREFAEEAQTIISEALQKQILRGVDSIWEDSKDKGMMKKMLRIFFNEIKFTRDIDPIEEMRKIGERVYSKGPTKVLGSRRGDLARRPQRKSSIDEKYIQIALVEATRITLRSYLRLLSPDPWSIE
jgi:hypothetical protein